MARKNGFARSKVKAAVPAVVGRVAEEEAWNGAVGEFIWAGGRGEDASLLLLPRCLSDHRPIVLVCDSRDFGPAPFGFFNSWIGDKDLDDIVTRCATNMKTVGSKDVVFLDVLKEMKAKIKEWRITKKGDQEKMLMEVSKKLDDLDNKAESNRLVSEEKRLRVELRKQFLKLEKDKVKDLRQERGSRG